MEMPKVKQKKKKAKEKPSKVQPPKEPENQDELCEPVALCSSNFESELEEAISGISHLPEELVVENTEQTQNVETQLTEEPESTFPEDVASQQDQMKEVDSITQNLEPVKPSEVKIETKTETKTVSSVYPALGIKLPKLEPSFLTKVESNQQFMPEIAKPFTQSELASFSQNAELDQATSVFIKKFLVTEKAYSLNTKHYFYEALMNYYRAKTKLNAITIELNSYLKDLDDNVNKFWDFKTIQTNPTGTCQDGVLVTSHYQYNVAHYTGESLQNIKIKLGKIRDSLHESFSFYSYSKVFYKLRIENYIQNIISAYKSANKSNSSEISLFNNRIIPHFSQEIYICLSILFAFQRRQIKDDEFLQEVRQWIENLVSVLLRIASWQDHIFILNHLLRCPAGVSNWATHLVQVPCTIEDMSVSPFSNPEIDHIVTVMATLLLPIEKRDEFLSEFQIKEAQDMDKKNAWVLVDSDGEDDDENSLQCLARESDIIDFINQIPLNKLFKNLLLVTKQNNKLILNIEKITENHILKLLAWSSKWVFLLNRGIQTYAAIKYRQLIKLIARFIIQTVKYMTELWLIFRSSFQVSIDDSSMLNRLQIEYDVFILRSSHCIFSSPHVGAWQFLAIMPFEAVSAQALWSLYYMLHNKCGDFNIDQLIYNPPQVSEICKTLDSLSFKEHFEETLNQLPHAEVYYLLQTFANMALARNVDDKSFIQRATKNLLQIGFVYQATRDSCWKSARDLLASLCVRHSFLISVILMSIYEHLLAAGELSMYLFKELPLQLWFPSEEDFDLISQGLIHSDIISHENNLSRLILAHLNWDFNEHNILFLPYEIHLRAALVILNATNVHYENGMSKGNEMSIIWDKWMWRMIKQLRLHVLDQEEHLIPLCINEPAKVLYKIPDLEKIDLIMTGVQEKKEAAYLIALLATQWGHSVPLICENGFSLLQHLVNCTRYNEVLIALHSILPLFLQCPDSLFTSEKYKDLIISLFNADRGYVKMAKNLLITDDPGPIIKPLGYMIEDHLSNYKRYGLNDPEGFVSLWLNTITLIPDWYRDTNATYIVDIVVSHAFFSRGAKRVACEIFERTMHELESKKTLTGITAILSWTSSSGSVPTLTSSASTNCIWFTYFLLDIEFTTYELVTNLWKELLIQLADSKGKPNVNNSLKRAASITKTSLLNSNQLLIYRIAQLIMDTPFDHPLLLFLWFRFFTLYLARVPVTEGNFDRGSVGAKFFDGVINFNFLKRLKKSLQDATEYFSSKRDDGSNIQYYLSTLNLLKTFDVWLNESKLLDSGLFLPSLPTHYESQLLSYILQGDMNSWLEYIPLSQVYKSRLEAIREWLLLKCKNRAIRQLSPVKTANETQDYLIQLLYRLESYDDPKPPPKLPPNNPILHQISLENCSKPSEMLSLIKPRLKIIENFATNYSLKISEHVALDCTFCELLVQLYYSNTRKVREKVTCEGIRKNDVVYVCSGPASILFTITESLLDKNIDRQIKLNRNECQQLYKQCTSFLPEEFVACCLFLQNIVDVLQSEYTQANQNDDERKRVGLQKVGVEIFYALVDVINDDINNYSPTKHLLTENLKHLGMTFISNWDCEVMRLIKTIFNRSKFTHFLTPMFNPPFNGLNFLPGYLLLAKTSLNVDPNIIVTFLSKFDVEKWLTEKRPKLSERSELIGAIVQSLASMGFNVSKNQLLLHKLLSKDLMLVFRHEWPEHYGEILQMVLQVSCENDSSNGCISVSVWNDMLKMLGYQTLTDHGLAEELRVYSKTQRLLKYEEIVESSMLLAHHFKNERLRFGLYGLYPRYRNYMDSIATLLGMFGHALIVTAMQQYPGLLADKLCEMIWPTITDMFSPWLTVYWSRNLKESSAVWIQQMTDGREALSPWSHSDGKYAQKVLLVFVNNLRFVIDMLPASRSVLSFVWQFYVINYAQNNIQEYILTPIHLAFRTLPWEKFWPSLQDLEMLLKVIDQYLPECHTFAGCIVINVPWTLWLGVIEKEDADILIRAQRCLLPLFIKLAHEPSVRQNSEQLKRLISQAFKFSWKYVDADVYDGLLNWYLMSGDIRAILRSETTSIIDHLVLDLLQAGAEYISVGPSGNLGFYAGKKRQIFVRASVRLLSYCASRYKTLVSTEEDRFKFAIDQGLIDMSMVLQKTPVFAGNEFLEAVALLTEFLAIADDRCLAPLAIQIISDWLSKQTEGNHILLGVLNLVGTVPQCVNATSQILEAALTGYFNLSEASWSSVLELIKGRCIGGTKKLPEIMFQNDCLLAAHAVIILRIKENRLLLNDLMKWIEEIKPGKSIEPKLALIWYDILTLWCTSYSNILPSNDDKQKLEVLSHLNNFIELLIKIDNESAGWKNSLLGAIGVRNKQNDISNKCRFGCKALALYIKAQFVDPSNVRFEESSTRFDPKEQIQILKSAQKELLTIADFVIQEICNPKNSLRNINEFVKSLFQQLYVEPYLNREFN